MKRLGWVLASFFLVACGSKEQEQKPQSTPIVLSDVRADYLKVASRADALGDGPIENCRVNVSHMTPQLDALRHALLTLGQEGARSNLTPDQMARIEGVNRRIDREVAMLHLLLTTGGSDGAFRTTLVALAQACRDGAAVLGEETGGQDTRALRVGSVS